MACCRSVSLNHFSIELNNQMIIFLLIEFVFELEILDILECSLDFNDGKISRIVSRIRYIEVDLRSVVKMIFLYINVLNINLIYDIGA